MRATRAVAIPHILFVPIQASQLQWARVHCCPLIFDPLFRPKIWGGRKLESILGKNLPPDEAIGESWECADLPEGQSVVARGLAKGRTLHELVDAWGPKLLGRARPIDARFPLLLKFLDAREALSIQAHPAVSRGAAAAKDEAWYVLHAEPEAVIYRGLRKGVSIETLAAALRDDPASIVPLLHAVRVRTGDCLYVPGGTVHALGAGVVVAEIQTPSDTTYRLYDWGRERPAADAGLHIDAALACIRPEADFAAHERRSHVTSVFTTVTRLVTSPNFVVEKVRFVEGVEQDIPYADLVCWMVLDGRGEIAHAGGRETFARGDVVILPAGLEKGRLKTLAPCSWLEVTIPVESDLAAMPRPGAEELRRPAGPTPIQLNIGDVRRA